MNKLEEKCYEIAAREVASRRMHPAMMAKAFSDADGDEKKAIARYIKLRVQRLAEEYAAEAQTREEHRRQEESEYRERATNGKASNRPCCRTCKEFSVIGEMDKTTGQCARTNAETFAFSSCGQYARRE